MHIQEVLHCLWLKLGTVFVHWIVVGWRRQLLSHTDLCTSTSTHTIFLSYKKKQTKFDTKTPLSFFCSTILTKKKYDGTAIEFLSGPLNEYAWLYQYFCAIKIWNELMNRAMDCKRPDWIGFRAVADQKTSWDHALYLILQTKIWHFQCMKQFNLSLLCENLSNEHPWN